MTIPLFVIGQRWISESEPELGLGTVVNTAVDRIQVAFKSAAESRTYALPRPPLRRVRFRVGDQVTTNSGTAFRIKQVLEQNGLLVYVSDNQQCAEAELNDSHSLRGPEERLFAGRLDSSQDFELRRRTLELLHRSRKSPVRGFLGGRIELIPHQLYIAQEVANRHAARVMLSDEVGLGKTIEACLILHRLFLSGRASRILVLVPESLVHQWFVEMLRRFNVRLNIFDEERCASIEAADPGANPFLDDQLVLASIQFLAADPRRSAQAAAAGWDVLVVDEAHHLQWSETAPSREYQTVDSLSRSAEGLLLLTATPEQLGLESHFARLRLLDPDRYTDLASFQAEARDYKQTADLADKLVRGVPLTTSDLLILRTAPPPGAQTDRLVENLGSSDRSVKQELLQNLLDMHGPGRVLFRNTRSVVKGFPKRAAHLVALNPGPETGNWLDRLTMEFAQDAGDASLEMALDFAKDPRLLWLVNLLCQLDPKKVLLISRTVEKAEATDAALRRHLSIKTGIFHEGLTLVQRDRNAAWFAEPDGARLLICSEIGSEGRNFQFAHHLVLFDLPLNPELLEQRIGRLDRIGQTQEIQIHVPYLAGSPQEVLVRWYHEGLNAFESNLEGANQLLDRFGPPVHDLAMEFPVADRSTAEQELAGLLSLTATACTQIREALEQGRDRLLELNSFRPIPAQKIIDHIRQVEALPDLEDYLLDVFDHFGVHIEELAPKTWHLHPQGIITDAFPAMPPEGMVATCDRRRALIREDVAFLTWDHPMVSGAMDLLLGAETGNCAFAILPALNERTMLLEFVFVLETLAPSRFHADRFLPLTPIRVVINHKLQDVTATLDAALGDQTLQRGSPFKLIENADIAHRTLPAMFEKGKTLAEIKAVAAREAAQKEMRHLLGHELERLKTLARVNDAIRPREIILAQTQLADLSTVIEQSRLRLDSLRLIWKGPPAALA